jgi:hypothetical protein
VAWLYLSHPNVTEFFGIANLLPGQPPGLVSRFLQRNDFLAYIGRHPDLKREKVRTKCSCCLIVFILFLWATRLLKSPVACNMYMTVTECMVISERYVELHFVCNMPLYIRKMKKKLIILRRLTTLISLFQQFKSF